MRNGARPGSVVAVLGLAAVAFFGLGTGGISDICLARSDSSGRPVAAKAPGQRPARRAATTRPASTRPAGTRPAAATTQPSREKVIVYYFHRTMRCPTCKRIEELAREAVQSGFPAELSTGSVEWKPVNIESRGNEHFEKDYRLEAQSLVLVKTNRGRQTAWENLPRIWDLVGDQTAFTKYVQDGLRGYLYGEAANHP